MPGAGKSGILPDIRLILPNVPAFQPARLGYIRLMRQFRDFVFVITAAVLVTLAIYLTFTITRWAGRGAGLHLWNTTSVVKEVQSLSDLVTVKYVMEKVVMLQDMKWYGENRVLLLAHGVVKAGIDLKRLKPEDVTINGKSITIKLPVSQVMDAYLDDKASQVIDHSTGLLRAFDKDLEQTARQNAVDDIARAARQAGILDEATKRAREEMTSLLTRAGFESVEFR